MTWKHLKMTKIVKMSFLTYTHSSVCVQAINEHRHVYLGFPSDCFTDVLNASSFFHNSRICSSSFGKLWLSPTDFAMSASDVSEEAECVSLILCSQADGSLLQTAVFGIRFKLDTNVVSFEMDLNWPYIYLPTFNFTSMQLPFLSSSRGCII